LEILQQLRDFFSSNQLASGGLVLGAFGAILSYFRRVPGEIWSRIRSRFVLTVEILDKDECYDWFERWLSQHEYAGRSLRLTAWCQYQPRNYSRPSYESKQQPPQIAFTPSPGKHFLKYKGKWIYVSKSREDVGGGSMSGKTQKESVILQAFTRNRGIIESLLQEARDLAISDSGGVEILTPDSYGEWVVSKRVTHRTLASVVLDGGIGVKIAEDMRRFLESKDWYEKVGIPYRRGYLLYGPSGSGKSSLALALASEVGLRICVLPLGGLGMNDQKLSSQSASGSPVRRDDSRENNLNGDDPGASHQASRRTDEGPCGASRNFTDRSGVIHLERH